MHNHSEKENSQGQSAESMLLSDPEHKKSCGYYALFEQATDAIMLTDFEGNFIDVNSSLCTLLGYSKNELLGTNVKALLAPEDLNEKPIRFDLLAQGENMFTERRVLHKDGSTVDFEINSKKCGSDLILVIARNITERRKTESILQKSEANLQTILNYTDTIYVLLDKSFRIVSYNSKACGFAEKELGHPIAISEYLLDYFSAEKQPVLLQYLNEALTGRPITYVATYPQTDGTCCWYHVRLFPISNGNSKVYGVMMEVSDITEKCLLEQKLEQERIKKQQEITDAVITAEENERQQIGRELHDNVNQLLATARLYIGLAKQTEMKKHLPIISRADTFIDTAINEIRSLSHSLITPFLEEYGLVEAIDHLTGSVSAASMVPMDKQIEIVESRMDEKLKLTIYRVIQEQLNNIIKYAKATSIQIKLLQDEQHIYLSIMDNGVGFDTSKKMKGIGLMNIRTRASLFNGKVDVFSSPGNGCELVVNFHLDSKA